MILQIDIKLFYIFIFILFFNYIMKLLIPILLIIIIFISFRCQKKKDNLELFSEKGPGPIEVHDIIKDYVENVTNYCLKMETKKDNESIKKICDILELP